ncbi:MAG: beta-galactosidase, partial [Candidatus Sumerlaeota bacterium]
MAVTKKMQGAITCALTFSISVCVADTKLYEFFCLNAINPYHDQGSSNPEVRDHAIDSAAERLHQAKELGAHEVRVDMWWGSIEPEKGRYDWAFTDKVIDAFTRNGVGAYPIFCYGS